MVYGDSNSEIKQATFEELATFDVVARSDNVLQMSIVCDACDICDI